MGYLGEDIKKLGFGLMRASAERRSDRYRTDKDDG